MRFLTQDTRIRFLLFGLLVITALAVCPKLLVAASPSSIRIALDDIPGIDMLIFLTAMEHAKDRGLDITVDYL